MRLNKLKLAGFKSFVDPTTLDLLYRGPTSARTDSQSPLVAVIGPNGCGKSNIIDAIRWVLGESSAKNLRGETMSDVIFNGSSTRKPVNQASIELVFDNEDGSLGGEYARFAEISVRRVAARDGQSTYFLNGTRCRRKDITELFLGTGLGPKSYAIIEQGMISRVIEAKPEELRAFIEEAAGVSLYRKRRQETETRMRHTHENLERLSDIRQELDKQLEKLKRQSESAEKYKLYKEEQDKLDAELAALRCQVFHEQIQVKEREVRSIANVLEEKLATRAHIDLELEKLRVVHTEKIEDWKKEQGQFYGIGTEIARIEQSLQHHQERKKTLETDLVQTEQNSELNRLQMIEDEEGLKQLQETLNNVHPEAKSAGLHLTESEKVSCEAEEAMRRFTEGYEVFQQAAEKSQRTAEVEKARIEQLDRQSREAKIQWDRLQKEQSDFNLTHLEQQVEKLEHDLLEQECLGGNTPAELTSLSGELNQSREVLHQAHKNLNETRTELQRLRGRLASLEALQQAALGKTNACIKGWLKSHGLSEYPRLGESIEVQPGFERAVETVLGDALEAICVPGVDAVVALIGELQEGNVTFLTASNPVVSLLPDTAEDWLSSKIKTNKTDLVLETLLAGICVVETLQDALQKQKTLKSHESVVTREGVWLGPNWLKVHRGSDTHSGILAREAEIKELTQSLSDLNARVVASESLVSSLQTDINSLEQKRESLHQKQQVESRVLKELSSKLSSERTRLEHFRSRLARIQSETADQKQKLQLAEEETAIARLRLQTALDTMEMDSKKRVTLQHERETLRACLQKANGEAKIAKEKAYALNLKEQSLLTQKQAIEEGLSRLSKQRQGIEERLGNLRLQLEGLNDPEQEMQQALDDLLGKRLIAETSLNQTRMEVDEVEDALRTFEKQRNALEEAAQGVRTQLEQVRMDWQALQIRCQTVQEKLTESGKTLEQILEGLPKEANEVEWALALEQVTKRIERLGAINLAAIEEYESESVRKNYLDSQHKDLTEALETLENAIKKIDKETKIRFQETFNKVNTEFKLLFPGLFGCGEANLELIGEDLLEAGVGLTARPPGKRNSSIHLLSGGEKALTAVALVFAIFQLNPAPFCLLDEVDAPLDDANVGRFCELVKRLSKTVQFIFVTHNKLAMEMADHLVGVTMKEPGVSRLVSVDVEEAFAMVAS